MASTTGSGGQDEQAHLVAPAAEDQPQLRAQEPGRPPRRPRAAGDVRTRSAADIEALPGELRRTGPRGLPAVTANDRTPTPACTSAATIFSGATAPGMPVTSPSCASTPGQAELGAAPGWPRTGWSVVEPGDRCGAGTDLGVVPWATSRPSCITPTWVQICSTSESRWLETKHRRRRRRRATRSGGAPRGCPAGRGRWSARRGPAAPGGAAGRRRWPSRCRMPSE